LYYVITPDYYDICLVSTKPTSQKIAPGEYQLTPIKASSAESFDQQLAPYLKNQKRIIALEDRRGFLTANSNLVVHLLIQKT
ncbi:transcriptional regulator, partial [Enterococcus faecium]|nr:transcriptional regulator [Enterococcus faecium]